MWTGFTADSKIQFYTVQHKGSNIEMDDSVSKCLNMSVL